MGVCGAGEDGFVASAIPTAAGSLPMEVTEANEGMVCDRVSDGEESEGEDTREGYVADP